MSFPPFNPAPLAGDSPDFAGGYAIGGQLAVNTQVNLDGTGAATPFSDVFVGAAAALNFHIGMAFAGQFRCQVVWGPTAGVHTTSLTDQFFKNSGQPSIFQLPVKAPFVSMFIDQGTANLQNVSVDVEAIAPGTGGVPFFLPSPLVNVQGAAIGAGAAVNTSPSVMMPGKMKAWGVTGQGWLLRIRAWDGVAWDLIAGEGVIGANVDGMIDFVAPLSDWQVQFANNGASASNYFAVVTGPSS